MFYYAGIGSRQTPDDILNLMFVISSVLCSMGVCLRSGAALGADKAFELGVSNNALKDIYGPSDATSESFDLSSRYHGGWDRLDSGVKRLHARNAQILLGRDLTVPVGFVICWTPGGVAVGGTGQALRIAVDYQIPVYNLANDWELSAVCSVLGIDLITFAVKHSNSGVLDELGWQQLLKSLSVAAEFELKVSEGKSIMQKFRKL